MREYAKISPQFWIGKTGREIKSLGIEAQLIALYLLTCPHANMLGIYYLPITFIMHETGIPFEEAMKGLQSLINVGFCSYDTEMEYVWVHEMALYQIGGQLKPTDNRVKHINEVYKNLPNLLFLPKFYDKYQSLLCLIDRCKTIGSSEAPCKTLRSQEQEKEKEKENIYMSGKPDVDLLKTHFNFSENTESKKTSSLANIKSQAREVLAFLNEKTGRAYRPAEANLKLIIARLKTGATVMDCRQIIAKKTREWGGDARMAEYLRPATLFNATKFEQYMGELGSEDESHEPN